jgi:hypothetical protein
MIHPSLKIFILPDAVASSYPVEASARLNLLRDEDLLH